MHHAFRLGDAEHNVELSRSQDGYRLHFDDRLIAIRLAGTGNDGGARLLVDGVAHEVIVATRGDEVFVHLDGEAYQLRYEHPLQRLAEAGGGAAEDRVRAPMPGSIVSVAVREGEAVGRGQTLLVMESMKMETTIIAPRDGQVQALHYVVGQSFERDALLVELGNG